MSRLVVSIRPWPRLLDHPRVAFAATLAGGVALAFGAALWQAASNVRTAQTRFATVANDAVDRLAVRLHTYEYALQGARGLALAHGPELVGNEPFSRYVGSLELARNFPGLRGLGMIWRVAPADEATFAATIRSDGDPKFAIRRLAPHPGDSYITAYAAPNGANRAAVGFDLASEATRLGVAEAAMRTGATAISPPVALFGSAGPALHSFLLMLPIYRSGAPLASADERVAATVGWIATALLVENAFASLDLDDRRFTLALSDATGAERDAPSIPFFNTPDADAPAAQGITQVVYLPVHGRDWRIELRARPGFLQGLDLADPYAVGAFGGLLATALALLTHTLALARRRQSQVHSEQARRAAIVDGSNDAIVCESLDGVVSDWNRGAEQLFGHPAGEVIGRRLGELLLQPEGREGEDAEIRAALLRGDAVLARDTVRRHRDGSLLDVSLSASPILAGDGKCVGVALTLRDISAARRAASELQALNASLEGRVAERTALLESARHDLQAILDALPTAIAYWDRTLHSRFRNRAHHRWFGDDSAHRPGLHITELLGAEYENRRPELEAALRGEPQILHRQAPSSLIDNTPLHTVTHYLPDVRDGEVQGFYVMSHDVTAAKLAEQRLRASEDFLDRAGEIAGVGGWALDLRTMSLTWSAHTYRIHEIPRDRAPDLGRAIEFYPPEVRPAITRAVEQGIACGTPWDLELPFITAKGRRLWVRTQGMADMEDGKAVRLIGAFQDITAQKEAAARLEQAHDRFAIAADSAHIGVWEFEPASGVSVWDERMYRLYGLVQTGAHQAHGVWAACVHPDDRPRAEATLAAALGGGGHYELEYRIVRPGGEIRHLRASARVVRDGEGASPRLTGVNIDITEQKRAELDLIETSSLLHTVLESASEVAIIAGDPQLDITVFNTGAERLLGYSAAEIVGRATPALIHDPMEVAARAQELSELLGRPVDGGAVFTEETTLGQPREWTYVRKDGSRVRVSLIVTAMRDAGGGLLGYLGIAHDVTRQKEQEKTLREAMHKARDASVAKSQFLANMSHEIRTPMNAVIGLTYLLGQSALDARQADMVAKLQIAAKSLLGIINDVLDLSKIEADELTLERAPFALRGVLDDITSLMSLQANAKGIGFAVDLPASLPAVLDGDATRLGQVLTNLVANAIKFTDRGGVKLSVSRRSDGVADAEEGPAGLATAKLRFSVRDSGIGIAQEVQPRLFAPFVQADASTRRRFGGTGLGLSIVKRLVTLMGGTVWVESLPGAGSTFWVDLELPVLDDLSGATPPSQAAPGLRCLQGVRILLTDDSDINLEVASRILMRHGAQITLAHDGQQSVDLLRQRPDGYDLVLMDVQMPVLDGYEATLCIRNQLGLRRLPIIALTAGALSGEHGHAGAAGMNDFVRKPFDAHGLVRTVLRHTRPSVAQPAALATRTAWNEDTAWNRDTAWGDDMALPAAAASEVMSEAAGETGSQVVSGVASEMTSQVVSGIASEMASEVVSEASGETGSQVVSGVAGDDTWPEITGIDRADVRARLGGNLELFASMLRRLLREFAEVGTELGDVARHDEPVLAVLAARMHKLKGSASALGATAISQLADRTEEACRAEQGERARQSTRELAARLKALSADASAALDRLPKAGPPGAAHAAAAAPAGLGRLSGLLTLLDEQSLSALDRFGEELPQLRARLGEAALQQMADHLDNLEFGAAARLLRPLLKARQNEEATP